jgi:hypothetical protein
LHQLEHQLQVRAATGSKRRRSSQQAQIHDALIVGAKERYHLGVAGGLLQRVRGTRWVTASYAKRCASVWRALPSTRTYARGARSHSSGKASSRVPGAAAAALGLDPEDSRSAR